MEIVQAGVADSAVHVLHASHVTRAAVSELRGHLLQTSNSSTHCEHVDIPVSYNEPGALGHREARLALLQASYLLGDVEYTLKSLEEDLVDVMDDRHLGRRLLHTTCPMGLIDAWLQAQRRSHEEHVNHLNDVKAEAKTLLNRVGGGAGGLKEGTEVV